MAEPKPEKMKVGSPLFLSGRFIVPQKRLLFLLSVFTFVALALAIGILVWFPTESSSAIGTVIGAFAGILAVIWFSASLYYQSQQLKEQKVQFLENFKQLREDNRRSSLVVVRDLLSRAEERALKSNPALRSINDLMTLYMDFSEWPTILQSTDPALVIEAGKKWVVTKETPAVIMMRGIKNAAETYFRATGNENVDCSMEPELFVFTYGPTLWKLPFFDEYGSITGMLPEVMVQLTPSRASIILAYWVAALKQSASEGTNMFRKDKIMEDIKKHKEAGYPMPEIAKDLAERIE